MRVALLGSGMLPVPPDGYGAVERHVWHLSHALERRGHDVHVVSRVYGEAPWNEYRFGAWALGETRRLDVDVVHAHTTGVGAVFAAARRPFVYTSHSRHWMSREGFRERAGFFLEHRAVKGARAVIALTEDVAEHMRPLGVTPHIVPNGVDPEVYKPDWSARTGRRLLAVGALAPHKGQHLLVEAVKGLDADVVLAGPPVDAAYAKRLEDAGADVRGAVPDEELRRLYATSDVFVHLSRSEALSLAVLEAMASGLPLVASDVCHEQVEAGVTGFPIRTSAPDVERVRETREALERLLGDAALRRELGEGARRVAIERFGWDAVARDVEETYRAAVEGTTD